MDTPTDVVLAFCRAWSDDAGVADLADFFVDDATYHNVPLDPVTGKQNIAANIATIIRPGPPGIEGLDLRVVNIAANGGVVMTERVDVFKLSDRSFELAVMGTFEVIDGMIAAWRDYFDMGQFLKHMGDHQR
jgi:limonene-1,2-epoxide hydrolase